MQGAQGLDLEGRKFEVISPLISGLHFRSDKLFDKLGLGGLCSLYQGPFIGGRSTCIP